MSHPNPSHERSNEYPEDTHSGFKAGNKIHRLNDFLSHDLKASTKAGKANYKKYKHTKLYGGKSVDKALKNKQN